MAAVIFTVDDEAGMGRQRLGNAEVLEAAAANPDVLIPFASVDPHKGKLGVREAREWIERGARGFKFHPNTQAFWPNDRAFYPLYEVIAEAGLIALFHSGTTGIGAGMPGGGGVRLKYSNPMAVDDVAADFPALDIILAHPSFPWQDEALAIAVHKPNVYIDLSGWSPKYFPENLIRYTNTQLKHKMLFGSDFPLITPDRWLRDFEKLADPRRGAPARAQGERGAAARAMSRLSPGEIAALASELGLGEVADGLLEALAPAYRLEGSPAGAHRIGGEPDLIAGETWPRNADGLELTFIAQFDTTRVPELPQAPPEVAAWCSRPAFVRLFADFSDDPYHPQAIVALVADPLSARVRAAGGPGTGEPLAHIVELAVDTRPCWCLDYTHPAVERAETIDPGGIDNAPLLELSHRLHAGQHLNRGWHTLPQLFGLSPGEQEDPRWTGVSIHRELDDVESWTLLLQFDDTFADYGDGGGFFVVIAREDLAAGRYERAVALSQSG